MGFFRRLGNIVSANLHEVLERCENPELLLRHAIRGMEEALRSAMLAAARVVAHERLVERQREAARHAAASWRSRAEAAVRAGDDGAARQALRRQYEQQALAETLARQLADVAQVSARLRQQIESLRLRLQEARSACDLLVARKRVADARLSLAGSLRAAPALFEPHAESTHFARRIEQAELEAEVLVDLSEGFDTPADAWRDHEATAWTERELAHLKHPAP